MGPPSKSDRIAIFKKVLKTVPTDSFDFDTAAELTSGTKVSRVCISALISVEYTPSDLVALCRAATQILCNEHRRATNADGVATSHLRSLLLKVVLELG